MIYDTPLEWLPREEFVNDIIKFLEYLFIYQEKVVLNDIGKEIREKETTFREWKTYWPLDKTEDVFKIILDKEIKSPYFEELSKGINSTILADLNKEEIFKELDEASNIEESRWEEKVGNFETGDI
jgi:hypothetical protein